MSVQGVAGGQALPTADASAEGSLTQLVSAEVGARSSALEASRVLSAAPCRFHSASLEIDPSAPTATYYVLVIDAASLPSNGAVTLLDSVGVDHVSGVRDYVEPDEGENTGLAASAGVVLALSSTWPNLTIAGLYMRVGVGRTK
jgi:hypothetical protein